MAAQAVRVVVADSQPVAQEEAAEEAQLGVRLEAVARVRGREETESEPHVEWGVVDTGTVVEVRVERLVEVVA